MFMLDSILYQKGHLIHRNIILTGPFCTVFHAESEFNNETGQNTVPKVENEDFSKFSSKKYFDWTILHSFSR